MENNQSTQDEDWIYNDGEDEACHTCGGEGWLIAGEDYPLDDPVNNCDWGMGVNAGEAGKCFNCKGSGKLEDCWLF